MSSSDRSYPQPYTKQRPVPTISAYEENLKSNDTYAQRRESTSGDHGDLPQGFPASRATAAGGNEGDMGEDVHSSYTESSADIGNGLESDDGLHTPPASTHSYDRTPQSEQELHLYDSREHPNDQPNGGPTDANLFDQQLEPVKQDTKGSSTGFSKSDESKDKPRTVTDPITHLPIKIHDNTSEQLKDVSQLDSRTRDVDGGSNQEKHDFLHKLVSKEILDFESHKSRQNPLGRLHLEVAFLIFVSFTLWSMLASHRQDKLWKTFIYHLSCSSVVGAVIGCVVGLWVKTVVASKKNMEPQDQKKDSKDAYAAETTLWLNNTLGAVWPLVNPDLFVSLFDTLEDVMQASLKTATKLPIEGVSISDWGQGSEPLRIIGVRWLDQGRASEEMEGMEAEEGEFVNLELALSYKAQETGREFAKKIKNAHVFVEFWWKGGFKLPIWVDVQGFIATARVRLQLSPDPPFFTVCTLTLLGQPMVDISCVPLTKKFFNIMDIPIASGFIQKSIDAAVAEYVAPRSLRLELKQMLMGDDFKKDTTARGVVIVTIGGAKGFKNGDGSKQWLRGKRVVEKFESHKSKSSDEEESVGGDAYVTIGWAKFGKPVFKTRIITDCEFPNWEETTAILVGPNELNAGERLRVQLWDSDRTSADDLLGTIEVTLWELMHNPATLKKMSHRTDSLLDMGNHTKMPGELRWSVGYFGKTVLSEEQLGLHSQTDESDSPTDEVGHNLLRSIQHEENTQGTKKNKANTPESNKTGQSFVDTGNTQGAKEPGTDSDDLLASAEAFKKDVARRAKRKMREAPNTPLRAQEIEQQTKEDLTEYVEKIMANSPPDPDFPAGILNIQIHHGMGFELEKQRNPDRKIIDTHPPGVHGMDGGEEEIREDGDDLPSTYCTILVNHIKVYKTRVKWKTPKPFFNAGTERFVRDWKNCEVIIAVRDSRIHENDALLGVLVLPLEDVFKNKSFCNDVYPLSGGVGYGRLRVSMVFRSVQAKIPMELCGWNVGTVQMKPKFTATPGTPSTLYTCKLVVRTPNGKGKLSPTTGSSDHTISCWERKSHKDLFLPVKRRYSSYVLIEFHKEHVAFDEILAPHPVLAFCILWLKDIPDFNGHESEQSGNTWLDLKLPIWSTLELKKGPTKDALANATKSTSESYGEKVGDLDVQLRFLPGLSGYHAKMSGKDENMNDVLEILDCASEAHEVGKDVEGGNYQSGDDTSSDSDSSSDSDDGEGHGDGEESGGEKGKTHKVLSKLEGSGKRGPLSDLEEYKQKKSQLHRHNRGMMQWKSVRTLKWMKDEMKYKGGHMKDVMKGKLKHDGGKDAGRDEVETEV